MRLTVCLGKFGKIPGHLKSGKHQLPHHITARQREYFVNNLRIELENEMWLTRPYLTKNQEKYLPNGTRFTAPEHRWQETISKQPEKELKEFLNLRYRIKMPPNVTMEERWNPLHAEARWEEKSRDVPVSRFQKYSEMAQVKRYPDRLPRHEEKWDEWKHVKGIRQKTFYTQDNSEES